MSFDKRSAEGYGFKLPDRRFYPPIIQTLKHPDKPVLCWSALAFSVWYLNHCDDFSALPRDKGGLNDVLDAMMAHITTPPSNAALGSQDSCRCNTKTEEIRYWHALRLILSNGENAIYRGQGDFDELISDICYTISMMVLVLTHGPENGQFAYFTKGLWPENKSSLVPTSPSRMVSSMAALYIASGIHDVVGLLGQIVTIRSCSELTAPILCNPALIPTVAQQYTRLAKVLSENNPTDDEGRRPVLHYTVFLRGILVHQLDPPCDEHIIQHALELFNANKIAQKLTWSWDKERYKHYQYMQTILFRTLWRCIPEGSRPTLPAAIDDRPASQRPYMTEEEKQRSDPYTNLHILMSIREKMPQFRRKCMSPKCRDRENKSTHACSGCNLYRYCSKECQTAAWKYKEGVSHKQVCKDWGRFNEFYKKAGSGDMEKFKRLLQKDGWTREKLWKFWDVAGPDLEEAEGVKRPDISV